LDLRPVGTSAGGTLPPKKDTHCQPSSLKVWHQRAIHSRRKGAWSRGSPFPSVRLATMAPSIPKAPAAAGASPRGHVDRESESTGGHHSADPDQ